MIILLTRLSIFKKLDIKAMELLQPLFESYHCPVGTSVLKQGTPAEFLYLIVDGKVEISYKPYDGNAITVTHVQKGGLFGWSAVVGSDTYTSSATAIETLEALRVRGRDLRQFCMDNPEIGKDVLERLAKAVSSRWQDANTQVKSILEQGLKNKG
jgi:CRP-like cAMP-binding protein